MFRRPALYDFRTVTLESEGPHSDHIIRIHAPGEIHIDSVGNRLVAFSIDGWSDRPYYVAVIGLKRVPRVVANGAALSAEDLAGSPDRGEPLMLQLSGHSRVELSYSK